MARVAGSRLPQRHIALNRGSEACADLAWSKVSGLEGGAAGPDGAGGVVEAWGKGGWGTGNATSLIPRGNSLANIS
jgi:hypothetical protein